MRHAYLVLAHDNFDFLQTLISVLDDKRNDIFVHIDAKVKELPKLEVKNSSLYIIEKRVDVRWGHVSQVECECNILEEAYNTNRNYAYYHLISGVDLPIKNQDYIHSFFEANMGKEFVGFNKEFGLEEELRRKIKRYHVFDKEFRTNNKFKKIFRALFLRIQELFGIERYKDQRFHKGCNWFSITGLLVQELINNKDNFLRTYKNTFCADEVFLHTFAWNGRFMKRFYDVENEANGCMREIGWENGKLIDFTIKDLERLKKSDKIFARKFDVSDKELIKEIVNLVKTNS